MKMSRDKKISKARAKLTLAIMNYVTMFEIKHKLLFYNWMSDNMSAIFYRNDNSYVFKFSDILYDLNYDLPSQQIILWYEDQQLETTQKENFMSYSNRLNNDW